MQMVSTCNFWLNIFPPTDGISRNINPRELITGVKIIYNKHIRAEFGEYVQVHEEHDNTMQSRTTGAIATKPTGNAQGGHWFYSLTTGRMLDRRHWTPLPMPADVIDRIHSLAKANPLGLTFTNMHNEAYLDHDLDDSDDDSDYDSDDDSSTGDDDDYDDFITGVDIHNNLDLPDPPVGNADEAAENENIDNTTDNDTVYDTVDEDNNPAYPSDDDIEPDDVTEDETNTNIDPDVIPTRLRNLTNETGSLYPCLL